MGQGALRTTDPGRYNPADTNQGHRMHGWTETDWERATKAARDVGVSVVMTWALFRGLGWLVAWWQCGCGL